MIKIIGITTKGTGTVGQPYIDAVRMAGGTPLVIPCGDASGAEDLICRVDALLVTGGQDVHPCNYSRPAHPQLGSTDASRDAEELALLHWALLLDMPVLCICRGMQVLNVAQGGTLWQDIPSELLTDIAHVQTVERGRVSHKLYIRPESLLHRATGTLEMTVNSWHHQAVQHVGAELEVDAVAPDGVIEALSMPSKRFVLSCQFHPELSCVRGERSRNIFKSFVAAVQ